MGALELGVPTPVNDLATMGGKLFAACDIIHGADTCALAVYDNNKLERDIERLLQWP